ncbi:hypothetical protein DVR12_12815 [Chitinophaga silvatica]|uniref:Uncharacterized protein n=1 Tax=Chitinophaga silvatica TaxID=2282649 RepID=A0A3E1YAG6_9BACT|nr:hypothetical protein [Chitinophaga silvatica]RFS22672.1 hypothetical protein DVR12_12815 [Chitinophaga silvatica]
MKTSSKLIIAFGSWLFAMLLFSAIILRVNYSKGITNVDKSSTRRNREPETVQPFHALVFKNGILQDKSKDFVYVDLKQADNYSVDGLTKDEFYYKGDTLVIENSKNIYVSITAPSINYIEHKGQMWYLKIVDFNKLSALNIVAEDNTYTVLENSKIQLLNYKGKVSTKLFVEFPNTVDSANLELTKGSLTFKATNKYADLRLDSMSILELNGDILQSIKSFK